MIVFDTSSLVGALLSVDGTPANALAHAQFSERVIGKRSIRQRISSATSAAFIGRLGALAVAVQPTVVVRECRDPTDNMVLELALAVGAAVIVSSDKDLQVMNPWRGIRILSPGEYAKAVGITPTP